MNKKVIRPCVRDLRDFRKTGCPEKVWDRVSGEGCPCWMELEFKNDKPSIRECMTILNESFFPIELLSLLESSYKNNEELKNGLCEVRDGKVEPKPDPIVSHLLCLMQKKHNNELIIEG